MKKENNTLAVVVPCYNEEEVLRETTKQLTTVLADLIKEELISENSFILYSNDGSKDKTWEIISELHKSNNFICGVNLSNNVGHQNALVAGMEVAVKYADMIVTIDADLQDDINAVKKMVKAYLEGFDIVYGVRANRRSDTLFKKNTASLFYKAMSLLGSKTVYNHADFRLMSGRAVKAFLQYPEKNLFIRGIVPIIGFKTTNVFYDRYERMAGETKYPFAKMVNFAIDGITSFSVKPLRIIFGVGFLFLFLTIIAAVYTLVQYFAGNVVSGWSSMILSLWFIGSIAIMSLGIIGEYIGKIYLEVKNRPRYIIESILEQRNKFNNENVKN
ncbi:MAG: glycosyltransferase [Bacteroidales bacterium 36-12]|nr:MAG: glycosyltransferase [Bacteroidales bacterium 36-12]